MKKLLPVFLFVGCCYSNIQAQYPLVTIKDIQTRSSADLANCSDESIYQGDTVRVRGIVVLKADQFRSTSGATGFCLQDGTGQFSSLTVYNSSTVTTNPPIKDLDPGFEVEITGVISELNLSNSAKGETQLLPLPNSAITTIGVGNVVFNTVDVGELNDASMNNNIATGEGWESAFAEIKNVTVVSLSTASNRVRFVVADAAGNQINVADRFLAQCIPTGTPAGTFVAPNVGDVFTSLKGIVGHLKNNCPNATGKGYELHPFDASHYVAGAKVPVFTNTSRDIVVPGPSSSVVVSSDIEDPDNGVQSATLYYAIGETSTSYTPVTMVLGTGTNYTATIPAQTEGSFVKYYLSATDNGGNTAMNPSPNIASNTYFYPVRANGPTISDIQFTPYSNGNSGFMNMTVTTTGIVTASAQANDLGYVFVQEENKSEWAGLMLAGNTALANLFPGDKVTITGNIKEDFNQTKMDPVSSVTVIGAGAIFPTSLENPNIFTKYNFANEKYENMLIKMETPSWPQFRVVNTNPDGPTNNYGDYRIGYDISMPDSGLRVLAGRKLSVNSMNVSYVNQAAYAVDMNVPAIVVDSDIQFDAITGILVYGFGNFRLLPRNNADFEGVDSMTVGVSNIEKINFSVYPNPAKDVLNLKMDGATPSILTLFDITGKRIFSKSFNNGITSAQISVSELNTGCYFIDFSSGNMKTHQRLMIIK